MTTMPTLTPSLNLDERRLGMLSAMGISWQWPNSHINAPSLEENSKKIIAAIADKKSADISFESDKKTKKQERPSALKTSDSSPAVVPLGQRPQPEAWGWDELEQGVQACQACGLCQRRRQAVLGMGPRRAKWMVVGEGPGEQEDRQGLPFVGPAGQLLDAMLAAMGLSREHDVYITNAVKCRPPSNRNPEPQEWMQCQPYLMRQIELVQPDLILALGRFASHTLLDHVVPQAAALPLGRLRGQVHRLNDRAVIVSYHPAYLLRSPAEKSKAWQDLCLAMSQINHNPLSHMV